MARARRILIVCAQIDGGDVGEAWCGYEWVSRIARHTDATVLTLRCPGHVAPSRQIPHARLIEWDAAPFLGGLPRLNRALKPWYPLFYLRARRWIERARAQGEHFDVAHHLTPMAMRYPSPCTGLGLPFVIGPLAGGVDTPPGFAGELDTEPFFMRLRSLDRLRLRFDPLLRRTYREAATVICSAPYAAERLSGLALERVEIETEVGVSSVSAPASGERTLPATGVMRLIHVGRAIRTKGLRDAVRALALLPDLPGVTLDAVGAGEDLDACRAEAHRLGVASRIRFHGHQPHAEVERLYASADALLFPSFREATGIVLFEAMGRGLPVIAADSGGPGHVVDDSCGIRVAPVGPRQFAEDLAGAIRRLACNPSLRREMGASARARCLELALWDNKIQRLIGIYEAVAAHGAKRAGVRDGMHGDPGRPAVDVARRWA